MPKYLGSQPRSQFVKKHSNSKIVCFLTLIFSFLPLGISFSHNKLFCLLNKFVIFTLATNPLTKNTNQWQKVLSQLKIRVLSFHHNSIIKKLRRFWTTSKKLCFKSFYFCWLFRTCKMCKIKSQTHEVENKWRLLLVKTRPSPSDGNFSLLN